MTRFDPQPLTRREVSGLLGLADTVDLQPRKSEKVRAVVNASGISTAHWNADSLRGGCEFFEGTARKGRLRDLAEPHPHVDLGLRCTTELPSGSPRFGNERGVQSKFGLRHRPLMPRNEAITWCMRRGDEVLVGFSRYSSPAKEPQPLERGAGRFPDIGWIVGIAFREAGMTQFQPFEEQRDGCGTRGVRRCSLTCRGQRRLLRGRLNGPGFRNCREHRHRDAYRLLSAAGGRFFSCSRFVAVPTDRRRKADTFATADYKGGRKLARELLDRLDKTRNSGTMLVSRIATLVAAAAAAVLGTAGTIVVRKDGVTYTVWQQEVAYATDSNGFLTAPGTWDYRNVSISGQNPLNGYFVLRGPYRGDHFYWNQGDGWNFSWYTYRVPQTQGQAYAFIRTTKPGDVKAGWGLADLGITKTGGPTQIDANGYTRETWNAAFGFAGYLDCVLVKVSWSQVFTGTTEIDLGGASQIRSVSVTSSGGGTAAGSPATAWPSQTVTLIATQSSGYVFDRWTTLSSGGGHVLNPLLPSTTFTVGTGHASVRADFRQAPRPAHSLEPDFMRQRIAIYNPATGHFGPLLPGTPLSGNVRVLAHGWANGLLGWAEQERALSRFPVMWHCFEFGGVADWEAIAAAFAAKDPGGTVLLFSWVDENATNLLADANKSRDAAEPMGAVLAKTLKNAGVSASFSTNPENKLHLIGMSHGCKVVAVAARDLQSAGVRVDEVTLIDSPENEAPLWLAAHNNIDIAISYLDGVGTTLVVENLFGTWGFGRSSPMPGVLNRSYAGGHELGPYIAAVNNAGGTVGIPWLVPFDKVASTEAIVRTRDVPLVTEAKSSVLITADDSEIVFPEGALPATWDGTFTVNPGDVALCFHVRYSEPAPHGEQIEALVDGAARALTQPFDVGGLTRPISVDVSDLAPGTHRLTFRFHPDSFADTTSVVDGVHMASRWAAVPPTAVTKPNADSFLLSFAARPGSRTVVFATDDLTAPVDQWSELGVVSEVTPGNFQFTETGIAAKSRRFYRIYSEP